jgi:hypothetical protein
MKLILRRIGVNVNNRCEMVEIVDTLGLKAGYGCISKQAGAVRVSPDKPTYLKKIEKMEIKR